MTKLVSTSDAVKIKTSSRLSLQDPPEVAAAKERFMEGGAHRLESGSHSDHVAVVFDMGQITRRSNKKLAVSVI